MYTSLEIEDIEPVNIDAGFRLSLTRNYELPIL